jgi:transglutaminase-like putative cysteine protease
MLARCTWPREWPEEVRSALEPQKGIESNEPFAKAIVTQALGDQLRATAPWFAAKEILRTVATGFRSVSSDALERRGAGRVVGLKMDGARFSVEREFGSQHDLVATCVAALRAAGIPARPVVGISEERSSSAPGARKRTILISWGEVFMPEVGWVPFDPLRLRGSAVRSLR